jgi:cell division transport system permease protein
MRTGFIQFWRNGIVSLSAVLVMVVTLLVISIIIFSSALLTNSLLAIEEKVDINVYFTKTATESDITNVQASLEQLPEVAFVTYTTREQVLQNFQERNANDTRKLEALDELDDNPFGAVLNVKAQTPQQYEGIQEFLTQNYPQGEAGSVIDDINYLQNKKAIDRLSQIIDAGERLGAIITAIFIIISILITLNTIRLAMYISRDEIHVMKLVGARKTYITAPFIVTGALYGIAAALFTLVILWPLTYWLGPITERFFVTINIFEYFMSSFGEIVLILFVAGIIIGAVSSFLAIKRYLRVRQN